MRQQLQFMSCSYNVMMSCLYSRDFVIDILYAMHCGCIASSPGHSHGSFQCDHESWELSEDEAMVDIHQTHLCTQFPKHRVWHDCTHNSWRKPVPYHIIYIMKVNSCRLDYNLIAQCHDPIRISPGKIPILVLTQMAQYGYIKKAVVMTFCNSNWTVHCVCIQWDLCHWDTLTSTTGTEALLT